MILRRRLGKMGMGQCRGRAFAFGLALCSLLGFPDEVEAKPGTHPSAVSTFDTRASSVVFAYRRGLIGGGGFNHISYNANFTNTSGVLSSQFGLHYVNFKEGEDAPATHGVAGGAVGLINMSVAGRLDNGLPRLGIGPYFGILPTALISGDENYLSLPFIIGISAPWSPIEAITLTPWYEMAVSVDLDTVVKSAAFDDSLCDFIACDASGLPLPDQDSVELDADMVARVLDKGVDVDLTVSVPMRLGLDLALHLSDSVDFTFYGGLVTIGSGFSGTTAGLLGASFVWRWDDIVPAVLPPERRLLQESCSDIEARFRTCPAAKNWKSPEELLEAPAAPAPAPSEELEPMNQPAPMDQPAPGEPYDSSAPPPPAPAVDSAPLSPESEAPAPPTAGFPE